MISAYLVLLDAGVQSQGSRRKRKGSEAAKEEEQTGGRGADLTTAWLFYD